MFEDQKNEIFRHVEPIILAPNEEVELEARIYHYGKYSSSKDRDDDNVNLPVIYWKTLLNKLLKLGLEPVETEYASILYGYSNYREIVPVSGFASNNRIYQYKYSHKILGIDNEHWVKYVVSKEGNTSKKDLEEHVKKVAISNIIIRHIKRYSFNMMKYNSKIEMSIVTSQKGIKYEIEIELLNPKDKTKYNLWLMCCRYVVMMMNGSEEYYSLKALAGFNSFINMNLREQSYGEYKFINLKHFSVVEPLILNNLQNGDIMGTKYKYTVVDKIDGENRKLVLGPCGMWIFYPPYHTNLVHLACGKLFGDNETTILDGEIVPMENRNEKDEFNYNSSKILYVVSDVLKVEGYDVRIMDRSSRLRYGQKYINEVMTRCLGNVSMPSENLIQIIWKIPYLNSRGSSMIESPEDFFSVMANAIQTHDNEGYSKGVLTDGFIFTPENYIYTSQYNAEEEIAPKIYKWKPPHLISIDFRIKYDKSNFDNPFSLFYDNRSSISNAPEIEFVGTQKYPFDNSMIDISNLKADMDGQIGEFLWISEPDSEIPIETENVVDVPISVPKMTLKIIRYNKSSANSYDVVRSNWRLINNPIPEDTMMGVGLQQMFHNNNKIKKSMLDYNNTDTPSNGKVLLDLGTGKGGDLGKWKDYNIVIAVEPSPSYIVELKKRADKLKFIILSADEENIPFDSKVLIIYEGKAQDTSKIEVIVRKVYKKFDVKSSHQCDAVSIMNSATFFWESLDILKAVIKTIKTVLTPGGIIMWMMMDGDAVRQRMGSYLSRVKMDSLIYGGTIIKGSRDENGFLQNKIEITIPGSKTVAVAQTEYLTCFNDMLKLLQMDEYNKVDKNEFSEVYRYRADDTSFKLRTIGDESLYFSSLFHYGIIKKRGKTNVRNIFQTPPVQTYIPPVQIPQVQTYTPLQTYIPSRIINPPRPVVGGFQKISKYMPKENI